MKVNRLDRLLSELTNLMVVLLVSAMIVGFAVAEWAVALAALVKFFTL